MVRSNGRYAQGRLFDVNDQGGTELPPTYNGALSYHYERKPGGGWREIWSTKDEGILDLHHDLLSGLRAVWQPLPCVTGAEPGTSPLVNASRHRDSWYFFTLDLQEAFPSTHQNTVRLWLELLGVPLLPEYEPFFFRPSGTGLLTGMPASPTLFNLACQEADGVLTRYCEDTGLVFTHYLDDYAFSAGRPISRAERDRIRAIIEDQGWRINQRKQRLMSLGNGPVILTGVQINPGGGLRPTRRLVRKARGAIEDAAIEKESIAKAAGYAAALLANVPDRRQVPPDVALALSEYHAIETKHERSGRWAP